jgi:hypothetical protein
METIRTRCAQLRDQRAQLSLPLAGSEYGVSAPFADHQFTRLERLSNPRFLSRRHT